MTTPDSDRAALAIPLALAPLTQDRRWVIWRWAKTRKGTLTKEPYQAEAPDLLASTSNPATWSDFATAARMLGEGRCDGIGYVLGEGCSIAAVDVDDCRESQTGILHPWAAALTNRARSYIEVTPSNEGIRIIGLADGDKLHRKLAVADGVSCELYRQAVRYITISGNQLSEVAALANIDALIDGLFEELAGAEQAKPKAGNGAAYELHPRRDLESLIKDGCGEDFDGDRSRAVWFVINQLLRDGKAADEVVATIIDPANGISAHCLDKPHPEKYARKQVEKAQQEQERQAQAQDGDGDGAEIARLARLPLLEYERARKEAAEQLGVRASILDRLVDAERDKLGLEQGAVDKQGRAISFPEVEPWPEPVDGAELLDGIAAAIRQHVVVGDTARDATALWVVHTYLVKAFLISPRLGVVSPVMRCGKTTLFDILAALVWRALPTANVSAAVVFRVVEMYRPCLLIDEADTFLDVSDELRGVLNSGHRKGGQVLRSVGDDHEPRAFSTYGACAIALIGALPGTLNDRAVRIDLKRRLKNEPIAPFSINHTGHLVVLARKAVRWAADNADRIGETNPQMPDGVFNREADNWRPLLAIAEAAGGSWPERARKAAEEAHAAGGEGEAAQIEVLLSDIRTIFAEKGIRAEDGEDKITSTELVEALVAIEGRPWAEMGRGRKPLTTNRLAKLLRPLGIGPGDIWVAGKALKGYLAHRFRDAFARFCPEEGPRPRDRDKCDEQRTTGTFSTARDGPGLAVGKCEKSNNDGGSRGLAVAKGGSGGNTHTPLPGGAPGLSPWHIRQLADVYQKGIDAQYDATGTVDSAVLDRELRAALAAECLPEFIGVEFERVMKLVFEI